MYLNEEDYKKKYKCKCGVKTLEERLSNEMVFCENKIVKTYKLIRTIKELEYDYIDEVADFEDGYYYCGECEEELEEVD